MPVDLTFLGAFGGAAADPLAVVGRLGLDALSMLVLVGLLYRRRESAPEMALVFTALNVGLFAAVVAIGSGDFPTGIGFGLFGLLSLVRLRSAAFSLKDVAYTFVALVLALVDGLPGRHLLLVVAMDVLLLAAVWLVDASRTAPPTRSVRVVLDRALTEPSRVRAEVAERWGVVPLGVTVLDVDFVRDTTQVVVRFLAEDAGAGRTDLRAHDEELDVRAEGGPRAH